MGVPWGWGHYWKSWEMPPLTDAVVDLLVDAAEPLPTPQSYVSVFQLGGALHAFRLNQNIRPSARP